MQDSVEQVVSKHDHYTSTVQYQNSDDYNPMQLKVNFAEQTHSMLCDRMSDEIAIPVCCFNNNEFNFIVPEECPHKSEQLVTTQGVMEDV